MATQRITVAPEYDEQALATLLEVLDALGAKCEHHWSGVGGSQDISRWQFRIDDQRVTVEAETYLGLSVSGCAELVQQIADRVASQRD